VVPVEAASAAPLEVVLDALERAAARLDTAQTHVRAYVGWVLGGHAPYVDLSAIATSAASLEGAARTYRDVAALGFAAAAGAARADQRERLRQGLEWLEGRSYFVPNRPPGFEADGIALAGVAAGIRDLDEFPDSDRLAGWLRALLQEVHERAMLGGGWEAAFALAAQLLLRAPGGTPPQVEPNVPADLAVAFAAHGLAAITAEQEGGALETIMSMTFRGHGPERAATQIVALRWLLRSSPSALPRRATAPDVVEILEGVRRSLRRWTWEQKPRTRGSGVVRWAIDNEYHVQDLLWVVLAPIFPDLEDEENLPSLGQKHPRADLGIPSLNLIVEAKFVYDGSSREFANIIEQVAADASLYVTSSSAYRHVIPFVWDDSGHVEQHAELMQGLVKIPSVAGAVVVTRPGKMRHDRGSREPLR
jgi:hypothetical protein